MRVQAITLALVAAAVMAPPAGAATQTAQGGQVSASFSFTGRFPNYSHERLTISVAGQVRYDQPVVSAVCGAQCAPGSPSPRHPSVHVVDLEHDAQPNVVLDLFSGGAHCCSIEQVFSFDAASNTYVKTERDFGNPGAQLVDLRHDGQWEFLTADDAFAYAFTDYAASGLPIQILAFANRSFRDVTRSFPKLIARDAAGWLRVFRSLKRYHYVDSVGVVAAWAADEELLGHGRLVNRFLTAQAQAGHLNTVAQRAGTRFIAHLRRFLRRHGYLS